MRNYESGGVPPPPAYLRDVFNKCEKCGATWIGPLRPTCSACEHKAAWLKVGQGMAAIENAPPLPESARADMMRQLVGRGVHVARVTWKPSESAPFKGLEYDAMWVDDVTPVSDDPASW